MAVSAGWQPHDIDKEVRAGRWTPLRRSVYALRDDVPADGPSRIAVDVAAAHLASQHDLVGTHETAALVHGLPLFAPYEGPVLLSRHRTRAQGRPGQGAPAQRVSEIPAHHRATVNGAEVTTVARTAIDLARSGPALSAVVVLDGALRLGIPRQEFEQVLHECRGWPGIQQAREWVGFADFRGVGARVRRALADAPGRAAAAGPAGVDQRCRRADRQD
jgi:hypothetical protein